MREQSISLPFYRRLRVGRIDSTFDVHTGPLGAGRLWKTIRANGTRELVETAPLPMPQLESPIRVQVSDPNPDGHLLVPYPQLLLQILHFRLLVLLDIALNNPPFANEGMDLAQEHLNELRNQQNQLLLVYLHMVAKLLALYEVLALYLGLDLKLKDLDL